MSSTELRIHLGMRGRIRALAESIPAEKALEIPEGFTNNIAWNICHLVVTQQLLCYKLSGFPMSVDETMIRMFAKGSSPASWANPPDLDAIYPKLTELADKLAADHAAGIFEQFQAYTTSAGFELQSIDDAIAFNNFHDGLHLGYVMALRRAVG